MMDDEIETKIAKVIKIERLFFSSRWATNIADAYALEDEIIETSEQIEYGRILTKIILDEGCQRFNLIHATARQRSEAWLILKEKKDES